MAPPSSYGVKDAMLGLAVGLFMGGLSGFGLYAMSAESMGCHREAGRVDCRLSRWVLAVPVRDARLSDVRGASVESYRSSPRTFPGSNRQVDDESTYHVRYETSTGPVTGAESPQRAEHQAIVDGVQSLLDDPTATTYDASLGGGPIGWRFALGVLFVVGALCLVNIPFATVNAIRDRSRGPAAVAQRPPNT